MGLLLDPQNDTLAQPPAPKFSTPAPKLMSDTADQNFSNHTKWVPLYHFVGTPVAVALFVWNLRHVFKEPTTESGLLLLSSIAILILIALVRLFPLKVQDRLIRLEEQLRLMRLLPADMQSRIGEFTEHQLVAMRFASDAELPDLARKVLNEKITSRKEVKQQIKNWRPDTFRV